MLARLTAVLVLLVMVLSVVTVIALQEQKVTGVYINSVGVSLPPDAAPLEYQAFTSFKPENRFLDMATSHYQVISHDYALVNEPLVRVDRNYNLIPAAATHWDVSEDGLIWTFYLQPDLIFADGHPLTARDF